MNSLKQESHAPRLHRDVWEENCIQSIWTVHTPCKTFLDNGADRTRTTKHQRGREKGLLLWHETTSIVGETNENVNEGRYYQSDGTIAQRIMYTRNPGITGTNDPTTNSILTVVTSQPSQSAMPAQTPAMSLLRVERRRFFSWVIFV